MKVEIVGTNWKGWQCHLFNDKGEEFDIRRASDTRMSYADCVELKRDLEKAFAKEGANA